MKVFSLTVIIVKWRVNFLQFLRRSVGLLSGKIRAALGAGMSQVASRKGGHSVLKYREEPHILLWSRTLPSQPKFFQSFDLGN